VRTIAGLKIADEARFNGFHWLVLLWCGLILAPILIGYLVSLALPLQHNFIAIAIPAGIAALAISLVKHRRSDVERSRARASSAIGVASTVVPLRRA
jgi:hypothetical protein